MALILVFDEEEDACQLMRRILTDAGHRTVAFSDAGEAMEWLRTNSPELVLLDFKLRGTGELGVLSFICRNRPEIKTVLITGRSSPEVEKRAAQLGIRDYLIKPLGIGEIEEHISRVLGQP
ncbi:MAG: response regulator [Syntrophobacteraceae bacterium]